MTKQPDFEISKHRMSAGEIRAILKNHKPTEVRCWQDSYDKIEYLSLHFDFLGVKFKLYSTHNYPWKEDTNVDWKQFISDARLKSVSRAIKHKPEL